MRIVALIDDAGVIERILKHLSVWDPLPESRSPAGTRRRDPAPYVIERGLRFGWWDLERDTLFERLRSRQTFIDLIAKLRADMRQKLNTLESMEQSGRLERPY